MNEYGYGRTPVTFLALEARNGMDDDLHADGASCDDQAPALNRPKLKVRWAAHPASRATTADGRSSACPVI